jgi:hypothetical protein
MRFRHIRVSGEAASRPVRPDRVVATLAGILLQADVAHALPTPDVLIGFGNLFPVMAGAIASLVAGLRLHRRWLFGRSGGGSASGVALGIMVLVVGALAVAGWSVAEGSRRRQVEAIAMYLRCDLGAHESRRRQLPLPQELRQPRWSRVRFEAWPDSGQPSWIAAESAVVLVCAVESAIGYASGMPVLDVGGRARVFEHVRPLELAHWLREKAGARTVCLADFHLEPYAGEERSLDSLAVALERFERVVMVPETGGVRRVVSEPGGGLRPVDERRGFIRWPVRDESWIHDERRVRFPRMTRLLDDRELVRHLEDPEVTIVAPFVGALRRADTYREDFLDPLLARVAPERRIVLDVSSPSISGDLERAAERLDRRQFVLVGVTKYDYLYAGLDAAFVVWERLGRNPGRFRLLGSSARLPEAIALQWHAESTRIGPRLVRLFKTAVLGLAEALDVTWGAALFALALIVRAAFLPLGVLESRSRFLRRFVERSAGAEPLPAWRGSADVLLRQLGARRRWELLGGLLTLALVVPAFQALTGPDPDLLPLEVSMWAEQDFLWIHDLAAADPILSLCAALLVAARVATGGLAPANPAALGGLALATAALLALVPAAVVVWLCGVAMAGYAADRMGERLGRRALVGALIPPR